MAEDIRDLLRQQRGQSIHQRRNARATLRLHGRLLPRPYHAQHGFDGNDGNRRRNPAGRPCFAHSTSLARPRGRAANEIEQQQRGARVRFLRFVLEVSPRPRGRTETPGPLLDDMPLPLNRRPSCSICGLFVLHSWSFWRQGWTPSEAVAALPTLAARSARTLSFPGEGNKRWLPLAANDESPARKSK